MRQHHGRDLALAAIIGLLVLAIGLRAPIFLTLRTALDVVNDSGILVLLVMGQMLVLLTRGVDLSVASTLALTGMLCAQAGRAWPELGVVSLMGLAAAIGATLGAFNGLLITRFQLPAIVVTLGTMSAYRGAIFLVSGGAWVNEQHIHPAIKALPRAEWLGGPALGWIALAAALATAGLLRWRREGRDLYAYGGNPSAAQVVGIPVQRRLFMAYTLSGLLAGVGGLLWVGRYAIAFTELATGYELTVIAACVIGGVSIAGGVGTVTGAVLGVAFIGVVNGALPVIQVSPFWQQAIAGAVILTSVALNARSGRQHRRQILAPQGATAATVPPTAAASTAPSQGAPA
ncbi:ABC transporter permease [Ideonella sp. TBM-1]|uniref:Autoinducer 2 import system permease protein LsrC n=1 Tax=Ideonella livida TaxID=2707176 RepID=A0A7C9PK31_9BURK|nr:ABC transporter permease [Ideonella livida]